MLVIDKNESKEWGDLILYRAIDEDTGEKHGWVTENIILGEGCKIEKECRVYSKSLNGVVHLSDVEITGMSDIGVNSGFFYRCIFSKSCICDFGETAEVTNCRISGKVEVIDEGGLRVKMDNVQIRHGTLLESGDGVTILNSCFADSSIIKIQPQMELLMNNVNIGYKSVLRIATANNLTLDNITIGEKCRVEVDKGELTYAESIVGERINDNEQVEFTGDQE